MKKIINILIIFLFAVISFNSNLAFGAEKENTEIDVITQKASDYLLDFSQCESAGSNKGDCIDGILRFSNLGYEDQKRECDQFSDETENTYCLDIVDSIKQFNEDVVQAKQVEEQKMRNIRQNLELMTIAVNYGPFIIILLSIIIFYVFRKKYLKYLLALIGGLIPLGVFLSRYYLYILV